MEENVKGTEVQENTQKVESPVEEKTAVTVMEPVKAQKGDDVRPAEVQKDKDVRPARGSKYEPISTMGFVGILILMAIPLVGGILTIIWACGGCRKKQKSSFARATIIVGVLNLVLTILICCAVVNVVTAAVEELGERYEVNIEEVGRLVEGVMTGELSGESGELVGNMVGNYIASEMDLSAEEKEQLDEVIGAYLNGEITISEEELNQLFEQVGITVSTDAGSAG